MELTNQDKIYKLQNLIVDSLVPLINSDYVLLDVPNHGNIGDHLIYEGELLFLSKYVNKFSCTYSANLSICDLSNITESNVILLHGGGNLGDIYLKHQNFRINVIKNFLQNRIIILPQTVYYKNDDKLRKDCDVFNSHQDLFICVRDKISYDILAQYISSNKLVLLPDMAFFINLRDNNRLISSVNRKALLMYRVDIESVGDPDLKIVQFLVNQGYTLDIKDWPTYYKTLDVILYNKFNKLRNKIFKLILKSSVFGSLVSADTNDLLLKNHYIRSGIDYMKPYEVIYTTRLHGLILAILLGKKVVALDNSYGKLSSFYDAWLSDFIDVELLKK